MAKIFYKKKLYGFEKDCEDEFGKYRWYFRIYRCFPLRVLVTQPRHRICSPTRKTKRLYEYGIRAS